MNVKPFAYTLLFFTLIVPSIGRELGEPDLDSDDFTKRFTASYGVLSEREPSLSEIEVAILEKMAPLMRVNREYAQTLLQSLTAAESKSSPSFNYLLGNVYFENGEYFLAEEQYKKAIEGFPDFQRAWTNLGVLKLRSGDTRNALTALLKAVELGDYKAHTFGMLGFCHFSEGNYISAEVAYDRAILADPDNLDWLEGKAQVYFKAERYLEAIRTQDELIARRPTNVAYWLAQTNSYLAAGDIEETARNLEIVRLMGAADFNALFLLGSLYAKLEMHHAAGETYLAAAEFAEENDINFITKAARQLLHNDQPELARELFQTLDTTTSDLDNETLFAYKLTEGELAGLDGDIPAAIESLEEAEQIDPLNGEVLIKLARLYNTLGDRDKAYYLLDRASSDPTAEYNALLTRVKFLIDEQRFVESRDYVLRALQLQSNEEIQVLYNQVQQAAQDRG